MLEASISEIYKHGAVPSMETAVEAYRRRLSEKDDIITREEEIKTEKTIKGVLDGVKGFESETLKNVKTKEPASPIAVAQVCIEQN